MANPEKKRDAGLDIKGTYKGGIMVRGIGPGGGPHANASGPVGPTHPSHPRLLKKKETWRFARQRGGAGADLSLFLHPRHARCANDQKMIHSAQRTHLVLREGGLHASIPDKLTIRDSRQRWVEAERCRHDQPSKHQLLSKIIMLPACWCRGGFCAGVAASRPRHFWTFEITSR